MCRNKYGSRRSGKRLGDGARRALNGVVRVEVNGDGGQLDLGRCLELRLQLVEQPGVGPLRIGIEARRLHRHRIRPRDRQAGVASPTGGLGAGAGAGVAWVPGVSQAAIVIRAHSDRDGDMDGSLDARVVRGRRDDAITPRREPGARRCGDSPARPEPGARVRGSLGRARHPGGCGDRAQHSEAVISSPRRAGTPR